MIPSFRTHVSEHAKWSEIHPGKGNGFVEQHVNMLSYQKNMSTSEIVRWAIDEARCSSKWRPESKINFAKLISKINETNSLRVSP